MSEQMFLIEKRGLYYRPESAGYTGLKREAGRYSLDEASVIVGPNGPEGSQDGMSMWAEDDAPEYSLGCPWDLKMKDQAYQKGFADAIAALPRMVVPLEWDKKEGKLHWVCTNFPFGLNCWIKVYAGTDQYNLYGPEHYGVDNDFPSLEAAQAAAQSTICAAFGIGVMRDTG